MPVKTDSREIMLDIKCYVYLLAETNTFPKHNTVINTRSQN